MEVEVRCVGDSHYTRTPRAMLSSPAAMSASGAASSLGPASSPMVPNSPSQATISRLTTAILAGDRSRTSSPHIHPLNPSSPAAASTHPVLVNASPRVLGLARAASVNTATSPSLRHSSAGSPRPPASSVTTSPSIAARNARRLSAPTTPLFRPSPALRGQSRPGDSLARRNLNRASSPLVNPQPPSPQPPPREVMASPPEDSE
ncbi:hypothetical protein BGX38DRAFT_237498 [Terfezia claveryi]|nr:hypothetical protein BGX38DRAFT_237498 [Terfezia claveryi]